ncbi:MAG TPA: ATP-binding protein [Burkholderiaceae bacterium]|jgi:signal transduction histidine kinase|nr:ATP-binding protein [Burkholderiaceae bacterium]
MSLAQGWGVLARLRRAAASLLVAAGVAAWPAAAAASPGDAAADAGVPSLTIREADFCRVPEPGDRMPGAECAWETVPLAKMWSGLGDKPQYEAWYRLHFRLDAVPAQGVAMYVVAFNRTGRLFVNGQYVRQFGAMTEPLPLNWNRSQYAFLPAGLLRAGDNEIEIQQRAYGWEQAWLAPVQLGPEGRMLAMWRLRVFWQNELVRILGVSTATIGLFLLAVWLGRRSQAMYFWFGCVSLLWTLISLDYFAVSPPLPAHLWERCMEAAQVLRGVLMFMFTLRYCGKRWPLVEAGAWAYLVLGAAAMFSDVLPSYAIDLWYLGTLVAAIVYCVMLVRQGLRVSLLEGTMLAVAGGTQIALSAYDLWLFSSKTWTDRVYLVHFSAPLFVGVVATILIQRFVESLNAYERLAAVLEQRVGEKAAELERNYEQLIEARRNQALAIERGRIMSEMHDGIGSQLTLALSLVRRMDREADPHGSGEDGQVATVLRESIEDLQLIIDSLEPVENDLLTVLGTLRYRLQDRLGKSGIDLQWNVVDLPPLPILTPHSVLSILRIVQEAFANCLKHSGATRITVTTGLVGEPGNDEKAQIAIVDNGRGIDGTRVGRGLENMRRRAGALGGTLRISSRPGATEVLLVFPTLRAQEPGQVFP